MGGPDGRGGTFPQWARSVHVQLAGLAPGREYYYRFRADGYHSPVGRTRTAPPPWRAAGALTLAFDTWQHRDDQSCGDGYRDCPEARDPSRSILGSRQEDWLVDGFHRSQAAR